MSPHATRSRESKHGSLLFTTVMTISRRPAVFGAIKQAEQGLPQEPFWVWRRLARHVDARSIRGSPNRPLAERQIHELMDMEVNQSRSMFVMLGHQHSRAQVHP
jgi:hypothetical protein